MTSVSNRKSCNEIWKSQDDSEVYVEIKENMRGNDVYLIQSTSYPANDNIMELLICIDSLRRSSAKNIMNQLKSTVNNLMILKNKSKKLLVK